MTPDASRHIDPDAPSLGTYLAARRLERNLSAEELAAATGIHLSIIRALEAGDHAKLPSPVFVRGFIKIYAKTLDIDPATPLALYDQEAPQHESAPPIGPDILSKESLAAAPLGTRRKILFSALLLAGLILLFLSLRLAPQLPFLDAGGPPAEPAAGQAEEGRPPGTAPLAAGRQESGPPPTTTAALPEARASAPPAAAPAAGPPAPPTGKEAAADQRAGNGYILSATFSAPTWMRVIADNGTPQEAFYQKGSQHQWRAEEGFELLIGNGGGVQLSLNGQPVAFSGAPGQVVRLSLP